MTKDMTQGNPISLILKFSIPLILGNLFQQLYNMVDTIIVGRALGLNSLTAVAATTSLNFLIVGFVLGVCSGLAIPVAQRFGAGDYKKMRNYVANAAYLAIALAVVLTVITTGCCHIILRWMKTPENILAEAYAYFWVICLGIPFTFLYNTVSGIIRALGDSRTPFYFLVISTVLNIILDLVFIITLHWGVAGAAWATIIAQALSGVMCLIYMKKKYSILKSSPEERKLNFRAMATLLMNGVPMGLQYSITAIGTIMLQSSVNVLDAVYVSAYAAAMKVKQLAMAPFDGIANACSTFCSQNLGAGKLDRIWKGVKNGVGIGLVYAVAIAFVLFFIGSEIAWMFVDRSETEVLAAVQLMLSCAAFFYPVLSILNCVRMTLQGMGFGAIAIFAGWLELAARAMMALLVIPKFGYIAVCFTDQAAWVVAAVFVVIVFLVEMRRLEKKAEKKKGNNKCIVN